MSATYVYGVTGASAVLPTQHGIDGAQLRLVADDGLAAIVSDVPDGELQMDAKAIRAHAAVLEAVNAEHTVLPMRFGFVVADDEHVRSDLLGPHHSDLSAQLREFEGKVELKLRATYEEERLMREILAEDSEVARLRRELHGAPEDATYYARIRLGELVAQAVERKRDRDSAAIVDRLSPLALAVDLAEPTHERIVLSASFLVERSAIERFDQAVDTIGGEQAERMRMRYSGPFPPHSFVQLAQEV